MHAYINTCIVCVRVLWRKYSGVNQAPYIIPSRAHRKSDATSACAFLCVICNMYVCLCVCMYVCMYIYIYVYIYTHTCTYTLGFSQAYILTFVSIAHMRRFSYTQKVSGTRCARKLLHCIIRYIQRMSSMMVHGSNDV
jgi:hypothetical protein